MFKLPESEQIYFIEGEYSIYLVILSIIIAVGASYTALIINQRIQINGFFHKNLWLILASLAMGLGTWSMHFVGMSAFMIPIKMDYSLGMTLVSMIPAIAASFIAFTIANSKRKKIISYIFAGLSMGSGIALMHYIGMAAMKVEANYVYDPVLFILSIIVAITVSFAALIIFSYNKRFMKNALIKWLTALMMGIAITSMHYTGMLAIKFYVIGEAPPLHIHNAEVMDMSSIIVVVTIGVVSLFGIAGLTNRLDKYVDFRLMNFDPLTQLPNQKQFTDYQDTQKVAAGLAIIHLQNLEKIISAYGYTFGDQIVKNISEVILSLLPDPIKIYRTDATRFTLACNEVEQLQTLITSLERICAILVRPIMIEERQITVEMIVSLASDNQKQPIQQLFSNAMAVLQSSAINKKYEVIKYDPKIHTFNFERQITLDIHQAMANDDVFIVYQPKINIESDTLAGVEALIRWKHPIYGLVSPATFIPVLEEANKIADLTDWIIEQVCKQISIWTIQNVKFNEVSINIPGIYVTSPRLSNVINENLLKFHVQPNQIELEVTETSVINDMDNAIIALNNFREKGLSIALDDFGTGLSSLSYLKKIPLSTIKIDKSFVNGVPTSEKDSAVLKAIVSLGFSLNLKVIIEGVETQEQINFMKYMVKKPIVQGYYYAKPLTVQEFEAWTTKIKKEVC